MRILNKRRILPCSWRGCNFPLQFSSCWWVFECSCRIDLKIKLRNFVYPEKLILWFKKRVKFLNIPRRIFFVQKHFFLENLDGNRIIFCLFISCGSDPKLKLILLRVFLGKSLIFTWPFIVKINVCFINYES